MEDSETCVFRWHVQNPFLPSETKEAIFCFRSPKVTQWKAFIKRGTGRRAVNNWPVSFSLQYFPPDKEVLEASEADEETYIEVEEEETSDAAGEEASEVEEEETSEVEEEETSEVEEEETSEVEEEETSEVEEEETSEAAGEEASEVEEEETSEADGEETSEADGEETSEAAGEETSEADGEETSEAAGEEASEADGEKAPEVGDKTAPEVGDKTAPEVGDKTALEVAVSVNFVEVGNKIPSHEHFVFKRENAYTYTYDSSIRPEHGKLEIIVEILIPRRYKEVFEFEPNLKSLSNDLKRLRSKPLYFDMWLQSKDRATKFPVHSYILDARWDSLFKVLEVTPNPYNPPTVETDILPDVLDDILTYLYSGSLKHFHLRDPRFEDYRTELFQTIDKYPLHHLYMMFDPNPKSQNRITVTRLSTSAMTFRVSERFAPGRYVWTHSPLPGVSVTTSVDFFDWLQPNKKYFPRPSINYTLKFTNAIKLSARVNLEYRRKLLGWDSETRRVLYECDHEIPCNGTEVSSGTEALVGKLSHLLRFIDQKDGKEGRHKVEHSFRFILYLSTGYTNIKTFGYDKFPDDENLSLNILSKHMSIMYRRKLGADLKVRLVQLPYRAVNYRLHKAIFVVRAQMWWNVVFDPDAGNIADQIQLKAYDPFFKFVAEFLYSGTCSPVGSKALPLKTILDEIIKFARNCGCPSLKDHAIKYRRSQIETLSHRIKMRI